MFSNSAKRFNVCTHALTRVFAKRGGCLRAAVKSITSHQIDLEQLEMLYIVYLEGRMLHAVSLMDKLFQTDLKYARAVRRFQL